MEWFVSPDPALADWEQIYHVVAICGKAHHPRAFAIDMIKNLGTLIQFDQSIAYFLDAAGKTVGQYTKNVSDRYGEMYLHYHELVSGDKFPFGERREDDRHPTIVLLNWFRDAFYPQEVAGEFIHDRKLTYSCDFGLYDLNGNYRLAVSLDRTVVREFTQRELTNLSFALDLLGSIYKNFFFRDETLGNVPQADWAKWRLTAREIEIVDLLSQGVKPKQIADTLFISRATIYKHIQHIYEKMGISSNRELMVKLLGQKG